MNWEIFQMVIINGLFVFLLYYSLFMLKNSKIPGNRLIFMIMGTGFLELFFEILPFCFNVFDNTFINWINNTFFYKYVLGVLFEGHLLTYMGTVAITVSIIYGYYELVKLKKTDLLIFADKKSFEAKLSKYFLDKKPVFVVSACFDRKPSEKEQEVYEAVHTFEEEIRDCAPFFLRDTDNFLFSTAENCITAVLPGYSKAKGEALKKASEKLALIFSEIKKSGVRILVSRCPEEESDLTLFLDYIRQFADTKINRTVQKNHVYEIKELKNLYNRNIAIDRAMDVLCEEENFDIAFQPIYSEKEGYCSMAEILIRFPMLNEEFCRTVAVKFGSKVASIVKDQMKEIESKPGFYSFDTNPGEFLERAIEKGMIHKVGRVAFRKACSFYVDNQLKKKYGVKQIGINLSMAQFEDIRLSKDYSTIMKLTGMDPSDISFEVNEDIEDSQLESVHTNLKELLDLGTHFSMVDFGTGFSNLINIVDGKYCYMKIDRELMEKCYSGGADNENLIKQRQILESVVKMIHGQGKEVILEGIDSKEKRDAVKKLGVGYCQGYYFAKPLWQKDYLNYLNDIGGAYGDSSKIEGAFY